MLMYVFKILRRLYLIIKDFLDLLSCHIVLLGNGVKYKGLSCSGVPEVIVAKGGRVSIEDGFRMNNKTSGNPLGGNNKCIFFVDKHAELVIGNNVGISQTTIIVHSNIVIGDEVKIGACSKIIDSDFHSIDPEIRSSEQDTKQKLNSPVVIEKNVFIGAFSIILKGVTIGENSVVGAGSVVTKSIPANQIWAGNPARFIKNVES